MLKSELEYELPPKLIAQRPADRRDSSRLLVLDRVSGSVAHEQFCHLPALLPAGALLVFNDTRVLPAKLRMTRATGGRVEGLFLREASPGLWEVMLTGSGRLRPGEKLTLAGSDRTLLLKERVEAGTWRAEPNPPGDAYTILAEVGLPPLPPYIHRNAQQDAHDEQAEQDRQRYQTIYARNDGAVAAPTAGLHFTPEILQALEDARMQSVFVTLHVGVGTFSPIRCDKLADHKMHSEWYDCPPETASAINQARSDGRPIVAVGTTSVRVLETCADETGLVTTGSDWTRLFIYPPYRFKVVDAMITNFHLPGSTLLAMIFALAGREQILSAYAEAVRQEYRFYSYGDAMLIV